MGYRTWLTLERPLNDRLNIILSRRSEVEPQPGVVVLRDHQSVLSLTRYLSGDLFVVGGEQIYRTFLEDIERWVVTEIPLRVEGADTFMPDRYLNDFEVYDSRDLGDGLIVKFYGRVGSTST
jgi:dihydrofolate reductase